MSTETADDGTFSMAGIQAPGLYLLTFARAGYQTQRFIVNAATLADADPLKVELKAGKGALSGTVNSAGGPVGAATVSITDGTGGAADLDRVRRRRRARPGRGMSPGCPPRVPTWSGLQPRIRHGVLAGHPRGRRNGDRRPDVGHRGRRDHRAGLRDRSAGPAGRARRYLRRRSPGDPEMSPPPALRPP